MLRKLISISCILLYLSATTEIYQLSKVPVLFEHYRAHKLADAHLTLWSFLYEHYANSSVNDPDYIADMQLPFKSHNECVACNISTIRCVQQLQEDILHFTLAEPAGTEYQLYKQSHLLSAYLANIWQPPKIG